jgi:hypothetical protein
MTDNLILSVEGRQSNASGFRLLSVPNSSILIIILVLIELLRLHLVINSIDIIPADAARDNIESSSLY